MIPEKSIHDQLAASQKRWSGKEYVQHYEQYYLKRSFNETRLRERETQALKFFDSLNLPAGAKVLDIGYGPGVTAAKLVKKGYYVHGVDISPEFQKMAEKYCSQVPFGKFNLQVGNVEELAFTDNQFECVYELGVLQYLANPEKCLKEAHRVLRPKGYLIIGQYNNFSISSLDNPYHFPKTMITMLTGKKHLFRYRDTFLIDTAIRLSKMVGLQKIHHRLQGHKEVGQVQKNVFHYRKLKRMIESAGFTVINCAGIDFHSKVWFQFYPESLNRLLEKINRSPKSPLRFANTFVFLAQKK